MIPIALTRFRQLFFPPKPFTAATENQFLRDYSQRYALSRQVASSVGLCICLSYFWGDISKAMNDDSFRLVFSNVILPLRLAGNMIIVICVALLFHPLTKTNERNAGLCLSIYFLSAYLLLLALTYAEPFPEHYLNYYEGMLLNLFYLSGLSRLLAKPTFILICFALTLTFLTFITDGDSMALANLDARTDKEHNTPMNFLIIFGMVGYFISLEQERAARHTFLREQDLQQAQQIIISNAEAIMQLKEASRLQAEQQNRDKSKFIAHAAHDLRNVLQPTEIFLDLTGKALAQGDLPKAHEFVAQATVANKALRADINAILDISELDSGFVNFHYSNFDIRSVVNEILNENTPFANARHVKLRIANKPAVAAIVYSDRTHLKRVLTNLVVNAIKYADPAKGEPAIVAIAIVSRRQKVRIAVIDNGIGIDESELDNIFNPLYQLNNPERDRAKGKGLGLSIVKSSLNLLNQHSFKLASKPGVGTRFSLCLPKGSHLEQTVTISNQEFDISLSGLYVLIVENDDMVRQSLVALMQENGAIHEAVGSMAELQALLPQMERDPDIVLSDYRLGHNFTATDVIATLNKHFDGDLPVLILTGETADLSELFPGRKIMHKPLAPKQLLMEIDILTRFKEQH